MLKIKLYDKTGHIELKLGKGKRHIITKKDLRRWEKIELMECKDEEE